MKGRPPRYSVDREHGRYVLREVLGERMVKLIAAFDSAKEVEDYVRAQERFADGIRRAYERSRVLRR